ncbi:hypothetical protein HPB50_027702 [Hyalomma asiaticum]|nr:hypothetical protein HPB50_027702 [Hyalomma asiaticum]
MRAPYEAFWHSTQGDHDTPSSKSKEERDDESSYASTKLLLKPSDFVSPSNSAEIGATCSTAKFDEVLMDIFYYLEKSAKQKDRLAEFQGMHSTEVLKILKHVPTRWLLLGKHLTRLWAVAALGESTDASTPLSSELCPIPVAASLSSPGTSTGALDLSRKGVLEEPVVFAANGHSEAVCELSEPPQRKLSQRSTASSSSQEVADIMAPAERLTNAAGSSDEDEEDEELEPGLAYDSAAEDLHSSATVPTVRDPSVVASTCKSQEVQDDGAWPQPPDNANAFPTATSTTV